MSSSDQPARSRILWTAMIDSESLRELPASATLRRLSSSHQFVVTLLAISICVLFELLYATVVQPRFFHAWARYDPDTMAAIRPVILVSSCLPVLLISSKYQPAHFFVALLFSFVYVPILVVAPNFLGPIRFIEHFLYPTLLGMAAICFLSNFSVTVRYRGSRVLFGVMLASSTIFCLSLILHQMTLSGLKLVSVLDVSEFRQQSQVTRLASYAQHMWTFAIGPLWAAIAIMQRRLWLLALVLLPFIVAYGTTYQVTMLYAFFWCLAVYAATRVLGDLRIFPALIVSALPLALIPAFPLWAVVVDSWHTNNFPQVAFLLAFLLEQQWLLRRMPTRAVGYFFTVAIREIERRKIGDFDLTWVWGPRMVVVGIALMIGVLAIIHFRLIPRPELYGSYLGYRLYGVHGQIFAHYADFFSSNPYTWFSHITGINWFIPYPYDTELPLLIGANYPGGNQNANFWAQDAIAGAGPWAIPFVSIGFGLLMVTLNSFSTGLKRAFVTTATSVEALRFMDSTIPTTLLTGGFALLLILLLVTPRSLFGDGEGVSPSGQSQRGVTAR